MAIERLKIFHRLVRKVKTAAFRYFLKFRSTEHVFVVTAAIVIGLLGGFGAVGIQKLIVFFEKLFWGVEGFPPGVY